MVKLNCNFIAFKQTWGNDQLVNYFLPISHYNWQWKIICQFNESITFNSTSFDQLVCQLQSGLVLWPNMRKFGPFLWPNWWVNQKLLVI